MRRTLAFSIHELAVILGEEIAQSDLVPVFNGFIKDLDEVRIGVLKHLAHFLRLLRPHHRRDYLPRMDEFLRTDNEKNWRFRLELATQLVGIVDLFSPQDCQTFLAPIALALMADKVVHIRHTCFTVVSIIHLYVQYAQNQSMTSFPYICIICSRMDDYLLKNVRGKYLVCVCLGSFSLIVFVF